jgi:hypothetical protein
MLWGIFGDALYSILHREGAVILIQCSLTKIKHGHRGMHPKLGLLGCTTSPPPKKKRNLKKKTDFVDT